MASWFDRLADLEWTRERRLTVLAVALVVFSALVPAFAVARPANQIPVEGGAGGAYASPTAEVWGTVPSVTVPTASAPSGLPGAEQTSVKSVQVQAARNDTRLYVRLTWADRTVDRNITGPREFEDAVAVQVPVNESARPPIAMGSTRNTVNVWYWHAGDGTEELLAGGAGTTTPFPNASVHANAVHRDGRWEVVFVRDLEPATVNRTDFTVDRDVDVAFAAWNGSHMERSGHKAVSEWYHFPLGPGPQGPPYEAILWAVAGAAIAVVAVVTLLAVRDADREGGDPDVGA